MKYHVAQVQDVRPREMDADIRVGVGRRDVPRLDPFSRHVEGVAGGEGLCRQVFLRDRRHLHAHYHMRLRHALRRVGVRQDLGAGLAEAIVVVGVIEMPVRVDDGAYRRLTHFVQHAFQLGPRWLHERIDDNFALGAGQHEDVAAGPGKHLQRVGEPGRHDRRFPDVGAPLGDGRGRLWRPGKAGCVGGRHERDGSDAACGRLEKSPASDR